MAAMGVSVWYPPQQCCGMPAYLEGDEKLTWRFVESNLQSLCEAVDDGFEIVKYETVTVSEQVVVKESTPSQESPKSAGQWQSVDLFAGFFG